MSENFMTFSDIFERRDNYSYSSKIK